MKLYIAKGTTEPTKAAVCIKQDDKTAVLLAWLSVEQAEAWASTLGAEFEVKELGLAEYRDVANWHRDSGMKLLLQVCGLKDYREEAEPCVPASTEMK